MSKAETTKPGNRIKQKRKSYDQPKNEKVSCIYWFFREKTAQLPGCSKEIMNENE